MTGKVCVEFVSLIILVTFDFVQGNSFAIVHFKLSQIRLKRVFGLYFYTQTRVAFLHAVTGESCFSKLARAIAVGNDALGA